MDGVDLVLMSPLVRAVQTAQILALVQELEVPLRVHRALLPDMPVGSQERLLKEHGEDDLVLVGHNPSIPAMAAHLHVARPVPALGPHRVGDRAGDRLAGGRRHASCSSPRRARTSWRS